ncbi:hypothetical protein KKA47_01455 [bacterium]|nr:hypothetical protein [bacterium]
MEFIWTTLEKREDGLYVLLTADDLNYLWHVGFVDTEQCPINEWVDAFEDSKQPDGTYHVTKDEFLAKDKHRYQGIIHVPFDAMRINEGKYTNDGLNDLIEKSIKPSLDYPPDELHKFFEEFKEKYRDKDDLIVMDMTGKKEIGKLIEDNPSPLRCLEFIYDEMAYAMAVSQGEEEIQPVADGKQSAAVEASCFMSTPSTKTEELGKQLKNLEASSKSKEENVVDESKTTDLKSIIRRKRGFRG